MSRVDMFAVARAIREITGTDTPVGGKEPAEIVRECLRQAPQLRLPVDWRQIHVHHDEIPIISAIVNGKGKVLTTLSDVCNKDCPHVIAKDMMSGPYRDSLMLVCWLGAYDDSQAASAWLRRFVGLIFPPFVVANATSRGVYVASHLHRFVSHGW